VSASSVKRWRRWSSQLALAALLLVARAQAEGEPALSLQVILENGQRVVVSAGELEPMSIGSYALRLYSGANPDFPYDHFLTGLVLSRDGVLETVQALPAPAPKGSSYVIVVQRSVGSGGYLSGDLLVVSATGISLEHRVSARPANTDMVGELAAIAYSEDSAVPATLTEPRPDE